MEHARRQRFGVLVLALGVSKLADRSGVEDLLVAGVERVAMKGEGSTRLVLNPWYDADRSSPNLPSAEDTTAAKGEWGLTKLTSRRCRNYHC